MIPMKWRVDAENSENSENSAFDFRRIIVLHSIIQSCSCIINDNFYFSPHSVLKSYIYS